MPVVESTIHIAAPPEAVTAVLLDPAAAPQWTAGLERMVVVDGEPGQVGCVGRAVYVDGGRRTVFLDVIEEATPQRHYRSRLTGAGIAASGDTTLEPIGDDATLLTLRWEGRGTTVASGFLLPLMKRRIRRRAESDLLALQRLVESGGS